MTEIVLYRMPDELAGETEVVVCLTLAINGVAILQVSELHPRGTTSPDPEIPEPLRQVMLSLEHALQEPCVFRDMRVKPLSVVVEGAGVWLRAEKHD